MNADSERRRDLGHHLVQGVVPRRNRPHHPDRLLDHQRIADSLLERVLAHELRVACHHLGRQRGLDALGELERHADLGGDGARDLFGPSDESLRDALQQRRALRHRRCSPLPECRPGRARRQVRILRRSRRHTRNHFLRGGVADFDGGAGP